MKKTVIWGTGDLGLYLFDRLQDTHEIIAFVSNTHTPGISNIPVISPDVLPTLSFDIVYIASCNALDDIYKQLIIDLNIPASRICRIWGEMWKTGKLSSSSSTVAYRIHWLESFAFWVYSHDIQGNCAEIGVYKGDFAKEINRLFFDRKLYLFDTFEGFADVDIHNEREMSISFERKLTIIEDKNYFADTTIDTVKEQLVFPELVSIKKGYFPDTYDLVNEQFVFVNIDTDLYNPIKACLDTFYPNMVKGGVILIHDYCSAFSGSSQAVDEFCSNHAITPIPNGDYCSMAIIKS